MSLITDELNCEYPAGSRPQLVALGQQVSAQLKRPADSAEVYVVNSDGHFGIRFHYAFGMKNEDEIPGGIPGGDALVLPFDEARRMLGVQAVTAHAPGAHVPSAHRIV